MSASLEYSMNSMPYRFVAILISTATLLPLGACSKTDQVTTTDSTMQGMAMGKATVAAADSNSVTLTAAQIEHGKIAWSPAGLGKLSTSAVIPGTIIPNENRTARLSAPAEGRVTGVRVHPGDRV